MHGTHSPAAWSGAAGMWSSRPIAQGRDVPLIIFHLYRVALVGAHGLGAAPEQSRVWKKGAMTCRRRASRVCRLQASGERKCKSSGTEAAMPFGSAFPVRTLSGSEGTLTTLLHNESVRSCTSSSTPQSPRQTRILPKDQRRYGSVLSSTSL